MMRVESEGSSISKLPIFCTEMKLILIFLIASIFSPFSIAKMPIISLQELTERAEKIVVGKIYAKSVDDAYLKVTSCISSGCNISEKYKICPTPIEQFKSGDSYYRNSLYDYVVFLEKRENCFLPVHGYRGMALIKKEVVYVGLISSYAEEFISRDRFLSDVRKALIK